MKASICKRLESKCENLKEKNIRHLAVDWTAGWSFSIATTGKDNFFYLKSYWNVVLTYELSVQFTSESASWANTHDWKSSLNEQLVMAFAKMWFKKKGTMYLCVKNTNTLGIINGIILNSWKTISAKCQFYSQVRMNGILEFTCITETEYFLHYSLRVSSI